MNAKPTLETVKARNSQLNGNDLKDRFQVTECRWLVYATLKHGLRAIRDNGKSTVSKYNVIHPIRISGCSRKSAIAAARKKFAK